jgi:hypothetical protein
MGHNILPMSVPPPRNSKKELLKLDRRRGYRATAPKPVAHHGEA